MAEEPQPSLELQLDLHPDEVWITDPQSHGRQMHAGGKGTVAITHNTLKGNWNEQVYPVEVGIELLKHYRGRRDVYLSTQRFSGRRCIAKLLSLSSLYADLDYYNTGYAGYHPYEVLELALEELAAAGIPSPTLSISSGRGLYLIWQHEHIRRAALPRWNACQRHLCEALKAFGADHAAKDAARVLRVIGSKNGPETVYSLLPVGERYTFNTLADQVLPITQAQVRDLRVQRALRAARRPQERLWTPPQGFTQATLWEARLGDLQRLRELRFMDAQMTDYRHRWLFLSGVAMSWLAANPEAMKRELFELAHEAGDWGERHTAGKLGSVIQRTFRAFAGETVEYEGIQVDPRYRFSNQRIIEELEIDGDEERHMKTIISADERRRRDRDRTRRERRESGEVEMSRREYEGRATKRRSEAHRLRAEGKSRKEIAEALGVSLSTVKRALRIEPKGRSGGEDERGGQVCPVVL